MMKRIFQIILPLLLVFSAVCGQTPQKASEGGKLIFSGNAAALGANHAFDGILLDARKGSVRIPALFKKSGYNFLKTDTAAFSADWFDDSAWQQSLAHYVRLSRLARQTGCRGIVLDTGSQSLRQPFAFRPLGKSSLEAVRRQVKRRGGEWIKAVAEAAPGIEIVCTLWLNGLKDVDVSDELFLLADFAAGVLDGAPDTVKITDGNGQSLSDRRESADLRELSASFYLDAPRVVPDVSRAKLFRVSAVAVPIALDRYSPDRLIKLRDDIEQGLKTADRYVFLKCSGRDWYKKYAHLQAVLHAGKDPLAAAARFASKENLLKNGSFASGVQKGKPEPDTCYFGAPYWFSWQDNRKKQGKILLEKEGVLFRGTAKGTVVQRLDDIPPGSLLLLTARFKYQGNSLRGSLSCNFRDQKNKFMRYSQVKTVPGEPDAKGWRSAAVIVEVPAGMKYMTVNAGVSSGMFAPDGQNVCYVTDIRLRRIVYPWNK